VLWQLVQVEVSLGLGTAVAFLAMLGQKRTNLFVGALAIRFFLIGGRDARRPVAGGPQAAEDDHRGQQSHAPEHGPRFGSRLEEHHADLSRRLLHIYDPIILSWPQTGEYPTHFEHSLAIYPRTLPWTISILDNLVSRRLKRDNGWMGQDSAYKYKD